MNGLGKNYKLITAANLLSGKVQKEDLAGKIVIMGFIGENEDYFYADNSRAQKINGVEVHAAIIDELIDL